MLFSAFCSACVAFLFVYVVASYCMGKFVKQTLNGNNNNRK